MILTEEELRQAWQNGRGRIPDFPPGTRFTPAALDFLRARDAVPAPGAGAEPGPAAVAGRLELQAPPGQRLILTTADLAGILAGNPAILSVHPSVTLTHAAQERLRAAGVRVIPWVEPAAEPAPAPAPAAGVDPALLQRVREAVLARLGRPVDPAVLDAVLQRVLAAL